MKKIGFVILTWNSSKVIRKCIESIVNINSLNADIVIVDNGSTDDTLEIINSIVYPNHHSLSVIKFSENLGTTISRNKAINDLKLRQVDYFCILDSDTEINENAIEKMIDYLECNKDCGVVGPKMITSDGVVQISGRCFPTVTEKICKAIPIKSIQAIGEAKEEVVSREIMTGAYPVDYLMSACWVIPSRVIDKVGLLDEKIFYAPEDVEYCIRVWQGGYKVVYYPEAHIIHEWQRLSKKKFISKMNWEHIKGLAYMFKKHKYVFNASKIRDNKQ